MFLLLLSYHAPLSAIDDAMPLHRAYLDHHYEAGRFVVSGAQVPRTGGFILAAGDDPREIEAIIAADPFVLRGLATYEVTQVRVTRHAGADALMAAVGGGAPAGP
jgi:uncharacterized protein YciI